MSEKLSLEELKNRPYELEKVLSEKKMVEKFLHQSQKILMRTESIVGIGSWEWEIATGQIIWSEGLFSIFQMDSGQGAPSWAEHHKLFPPEDFKTLSEAVESAIAKGTPYALKIRALRRDGEILICKATGSVEKDSNKKPVRLLGSVQDITNRQQTEDELRQNEQRYKSAQHMGHVGNWEYDLLTETFWGSDEAKRIYGFDPESKNFTTDEVENCIPDRERVHQALVDLIEKGKRYDLEFVVQPITGPDEKVIKSIAELVKNDSGIPIKVVGVIQDITDRKLADEELRKSEEKYRSLLKTTSEGFWLLNPERKTIEVNEALCKMLGYSQDEMLGKTPFDFVDDENRKIFIEQTSKISDKGHRSYEIALRTKKGLPLHTYFNATTLEDESGHVKGSFALITDITENKRIAEALRESEEKYRSMMEAMEDPIYICSQNFRMEYMNPAMIRNIGHDGIGESCSQAIYNLDKKCPWCVHEKIQKGESVFTEISNQKDGHTYHVSHSPIFHADSSISKMTIFRDITQRKLLEEEREKLIKELQNALAEIKTLSGLLPICAHCKKIRDDKGYWKQIEGYIQDHSDAKFSHGICPECSDELYGNEDWYIEMKKEEQKKE